jgi:hypothetical protein
VRIKLKIKEEKSMSRKKLKNRRRKDRAQRKILIAAVCIAAVIIGVGIGGHVIKKNAGKTMITAETESKKAVSKKKATAKKLTINENETDASNKENQGQKDQADDRSEFAVQPGRKVGTTEQSDEKVVYLTLDDGPSKNTQAVLDILDKYNAKATFFVTGAMPEYKDMIKKAYDKGHTIGMHTYSHDYAKVYASVDAYFQDLDQIGQLVKELAEKKAKLGTSCMKDFNFHTAHLKYTVSQALILNLGEKGEEAIKLALANYVDTFGQEYLDVLDGLYPVE